jgi:YVTN family beta-propeller protein
MKAKFLLLLLSLIFAIQACDNNNPAPVTPTGSAGYFVVNEGLFNANNTSISFFDRTSGEMSNDVFAKANGRALGDQAQSVTVYKDKAYIVVQHSAKIEVIGADDFKSVKTISDQLESPRYLIAINDSKAYVSDWADGFGGSIKILDLNEMKVTGSINVGAGPNEMVMSNGKVYVANSGGFGYDNTISVIDTSSDKVTTTIPVGDNPFSLQFDKDGNLWAASTGLFAYDNEGVDVANSTASTISKITNDKEASRITISGIVYPGISHLNINKAGDNLYFVFGGSIYSLPTAATAPSTNAFIGDKYFYGMSVDPITDEIIGAEAPDFSSPGNIYVYSSSGKLNKSYQVGIGPNGAYFK